MNWHLMSIGDALRQLESDATGLAPAEAARRLEQYGPNRLSEGKKRSPVLMFLLQFKDVMILILIAAAIVSGVIGEMKDAAVILFIVIINAIVGFVQEYRAEKAMEALKKMSTPFARVKRDNRFVQIPSPELVPGDIVFLEAGDVVPADLRLLESHALKIEEASLTGESLAVDKSTDLLQEEKTPLAERVNMAYKNTLVNYGRGQGIVTATGMQTEIGAIAQMLQEGEQATPLQKRLADFGRKLSIGVIIICLVIYVFGLIRGEDPVRMLLTAISVAVAAIPEALPAVITIALALGARNMVRKNALVRKLTAVETLGSVTYICTDKTGTLTQNKMKVKQAWEPKGFVPAGLELTGRELFLFGMAANQDTKKAPDGTLQGDSTEVAVVEYARNQKEYDPSWLDRMERVFELPFDSGRKMMTTVHRRPEGKFLVLTKGALESVAASCRPDTLANSREKADEFAREGERVLAYSYKLIEALPGKEEAAGLETGQVLLGLVGISDALRTEVKQAVEECKTAGIVPVMITGDHPITAGVIARELGLISGKDDRIVTGTELEALPEEELSRQVLHIKVYARVSPEQKLNIVKALQQQHQYVAMTGDGVNDAPALKRANIGVAMGITGTDVSKEAAHMILLDDNFTTIVNAVREGRRIFDNIRKFIRYIMTGNSGEIWTIFLAPLFGLPIPLLPIHILWINLVTDGLPALALANEQVERDVMKRPPRHPNESIFAGGLGWHILWVGLLIGILTLSTQAWAMEAENPRWQTMVFTVLCFCQLTHVLAIRSDNRLLFRNAFFANKPLLGAVALTFVLQLLLMYTPALQDVFSIEALSLNELLACIGISLIIFFAVELEKFIRFKLYKGRR
ncbi:cation-translocating P-type ATPase [Paraflavisolibacter sp. H34]|uniref:cation-translocating P-type ATPase n=1 Tax=Huijunlia imazamoxiresistens TaxID=3127457 RepID=UPI003018723F